MSRVSRFHPDLSKTRAFPREVILHCRPSRGAGGATASFSAVRLPAHCLGQLLDGEHEAVSVLASTGCGFLAKLRQHLRVIDRVDSECAIATELGLANLIVRLLKPSQHRTVLALFDLARGPDTEQSSRKNVRFEIMPVHGAEYLLATLGYLLSSHPPRDGSVQVGRRNRLHSPGLIRKLDHDQRTGAAFR